MVRIGITGHRFLTDMEKILQAIDYAINLIEQWYHGEDWTLISPLAEGSDQLFVQRVLEYHPGHLWVPLPMPLLEYEQDFTTTEASHTFAKLLQQADKVWVMPIVESRNAAYTAVGRYLVKNSDILVAIWDGQFAKGKGGTGNVVTLARSLHLPLIWIHAGNRLGNSQIPASLGEMQGQISIENSP